MRFFLRFAKKMKINTVKYALCQKFSHLFTPTFEKIKAQFCAVQELPQLFTVKIALRLEIPYSPL